MIKSCCYSGKLSGIRQESVNYVGYYSQHEETMKTVIQSQASAGEESVKRVVSGAMVDCRRDSLWQKLLLETDTSTSATCLSHVEFLELISLVHHETLDNVSIGINYVNIIIIYFYFV